MTSVHAIINRSVPPVPWAEGDNIPWNEPAFSERMLSEHLTQEHDLASRVEATIDAQVSWLHHSVMGEQPSRILDLACGPGLYLNRLAARGHTGVGIDFSPSSISHARQVAADEAFAVDYIEGDLRETGFGTGFDLVLLLYGQINVFQRDEAVDIVRRASAALEPGGAMVLEPQTFAQVERAGMAEPSWSSQESGLFSAEPHLLLTEAHWDEEHRCSTQRFHVIASDGLQNVSHAMTSMAYSDEEIRSLLAGAGLGDTRVVDGFSGTSDDSLITYVSSVSGTTTRQVDGRT